MNLTWVLKQGGDPASFSGSHRLFLDAIAGPSSLPPLPPTLHQLLQPSGACLQLLSPRGSTAPQLHANRGTYGPYFLSISMGTSVGFGKGTFTKN